MMILLKTLVTIFLLLLGYECMVYAFHLLNRPSDAAVYEGMASRGTVSDSSLYALAFLAEACMSIYQQNEPMRGVVLPSMPQLPTKFFKLIALAIAGIIALIIFFHYIFAITRIGAGYTGVEILLSGSQRGASEIPIRTGWVFYSPLRSQIIEFPTYVQTVKWTRNLEEDGRRMKR